MTPALAQLKTYTEEDYNNLPETVRARQDTSGNLVFSPL